jgi:hypothetical protein
VKALHDKVNSILSTLDLDTPLVGMLPHAEALCVIRYKSHQGSVEKEAQWFKEEEEKKGEQLQPVASAQGRHCRPPQAGTAGGDTTTLPVGAPRLSRPKHPDTAGPDRHCRPPGVSCFSFFLKLLVSCLCWGRLPFVFTSIFLQCRSGLLGRSC